MNCELIKKDMCVQTYLLTGKIINSIIINNLKNFIKNNKNEELSYKTHVKGHFTGFSSLVKNEDFLSFLKEIQENIRIIHPDSFLIQDAWGNLCKKGEEVTEHFHGGVTGFCGILYLTDKGPGTYFRDYNMVVEEEVGKYILFSPMLAHSVKKINNNLERMTVAFNMNAIKDWDQNNITWVNKNEI